MIVLATIHDSLHGEIGQIRVDEHTLDIRMVLSEAGEQILNPLRNRLMEVGLDQVLRFVTDPEGHKCRVLVSEHLRSFSADLELRTNPDRLSWYLDTRAARCLEAIRRGDVVGIPLEDAIEQIRSHKLD